MKKPMSTLSTKQKRAILQMADVLGNVSEACRRAGISRTTFYDLRRRFEEHGEEGLQERSKAPHQQPGKTATPDVKRILEASQQHPAWGCDRIAKHLRKGGLALSGPTVQRWLAKGRVATRHDRWLLLERRVAEERLECTPEQRRFLESMNPNWGEYPLRSRRPGQLLYQDVLLLMTTTEGERLFLHVVIDPVGCLAFGLPSPHKSPLNAAMLLKSEVLPRYREADLPIKIIETGRGGIFSSTADPNYDLLLARNGIEHRPALERQRPRNGFIERFRRLLPAYLRRMPLRLPASGFVRFPEIEEQTRAWMRHYNSESALEGYPNYGKAPRQVWEQKGYSIPE